MAVVRKNPETGQIETCTHIMSGKPMDVPFDHSYSVPVSAERQAFVTAALAKHYPDKDVSVKGQPWDYSLTDNPAVHEETMAGHYRTEIEGVGEVVVCVNIHDVEEAIALGGEVFDAFNEQDVQTQGAVKLPEGQWSFEKDGVFIHLQAFSENTVSLAQSNMIARGEELGRMVGRMHVAALALPEDTQERLKVFSDDTTYQLWTAGFVVGNKGDSNTMIDLAGLVSKKAEGRGKDPVKATNDLYDAVESVIQKNSDRILTVINDSPRVATSFNVIEKMVLVGKGGALTFASCDTPSRGFVGMLTPHMTYDAGVALYRIVMNEALYGDATDIYPLAQKEIESFVRGYNEETGCNVTIQEALEAAELANALDTTISLGFAALTSKDNAATRADLAEHIITMKMPHAERVHGFVEYYGAHPRLDPDAVHGYGDREPE